MKRLSLILVLAVSICSLANASYLISVDGQVDPPDSEIVLFPSQTVTIGIHGFGNGNNTPQDFWLICQMSASFGDGVVTYPGDLSYIEYYGYPEFPPIEPPDWEELGYPGVTTIMYAHLDHSTTPSPDLNGLLIDDLFFHCEGVGDAILTLVKADLTVVYDSQVIHQIPEPASAITFAVGLLFIASKRKYSAWKNKL